MTTPTVPPPGPSYAPPPGDAYPPVPPPPAAEKKHRKWPWIVLAVVVIIGIIAAVSNGNKKDTPSAATQSVAATAAPAPATEPAATTAQQATTAQAATQPPAAGEAAVGTPIPFSWSMIGDADQGVATLNTAAWTTTPPEFGTYKNGAGLILDVTVEATEGTLNINPLYWQARDAEAGSTRMP